MKISVIITYTLLISVLVGVYSVLVDIDHIFFLFGQAEPFTFTAFYGRPLHTPIIFSIIALFYTCGIATFVYGWNVTMKSKKRQKQKQRRTQRAKARGKL